MNLRMLGLAVVATAALMAFVGVSSASATVLCSTNSNPCTGTKYPAGTEVKSNLAAGTKSVLSTEFQKIECSKSTVAGKTSNAGGATETVKGSVETLTFEECNCTVAVLKKGGWEYHWISGGPNATVTWNGQETTVTCSTIFGNVHCIYVTENTHVGTITGGSRAKMHWNPSWPRLPTNSLCSSQATGSAEYEISTPDPLFIEGS